MKKEPMKNWKHNFSYNAMIYSHVLELMTVQKYVLNYL